MIDLHWTPQPNSAQPLACFANCDINMDGARVLKITPDGAEFVLERDDPKGATGYKEIGRYSSIFQAMGDARTHCDRMLSDPKYAEEVAGS